MVARQRCDEMMIVMMTVNDRWSPQKYRFFLGRRISQYKYQYINTLTTTYTMYKVGQK